MQSNSQDGQRAWKFVSRGLCYDFRLTCFELSIFLPYLCSLFEFIFSRSFVLFSLFIFSAHFFMDLAGSLFTQRTYMQQIEFDY